MPFYKITGIYNAGENQQYYGCDCVIKDEVVYANIPKYAVESYLQAGRVFDVQMPKDPGSKTSNKKSVSKGSSTSKTPVEPEKTPLVESSAQDEASKGLEDIFSNFEDISAEQVTEGSTEGAKEKKRARRTKVEKAAADAKKLAESGI